MDKDELIEKAGQMFFVDSEFPKNWKDVSTLAADFALEQIDPLETEIAALKERLAAAEASFSTILYRIMRVQNHNDSTCEACADDKRQIYKIASDAVAALQGEGDK